MLECQLLYSLQWSIDVFNSVVNTKLPVIEKIPSKINPVINELKCIHSRQITSPVLG